MEEVYRQLFCLAMFAITGMVIGCLFDIFRILRRSFKTADFITYLQDILFWILAGLILLFAIFKSNHGEIRSYIFLGIALGILIYMFTISKFFVKYAVIIIQWIKKLVSYPIRLIGKCITILLKPFVLLQKKIKQTIKTSQKNGNKNKKIEKLTKFSKK